MRIKVADGAGLALQMRPGPPAALLKLMAHPAVANLAPVIYFDPLVNNLLRAGAKFEQLVKKTVFWQCALYVV